MAIIILRTRQRSPRKIGGIKIMEEDLMLGDWVNVIRFQELFKCKVYKLESNNMPIVQIGDSIRTNTYDTIEAIPITEEILKKNNITKANYTFYDGYNFEFQNKRNVISIGSIWFVHELQHALRLIGLNEMADNFII